MRQGPPAEVPAWVPTFTDGVRAPPAGSLLDGVGGVRRLVDSGRIVMRVLICSEKAGRAGRWSRLVEYVGLAVPVADDPCQVMVRLAEAFGASDHVVYENPPVWSFAAGCIAEVIVTASRSVVRDGRGERAVPRARRPLAEVPALLDDISVSGWRAYGIAMSDLTQGGSAAAADGEALLMHLVVPRVEVRMAAGQATVRGITGDEARQAAEIIAAARPYPPCRPVSGGVEADEEAGADFRSLVRDAVQEIRDRGLQKVVLSRSVPIDANVDLRGTFVAGRARHTPVRSFLLQLDGLAAAGFSPEIIAEVSGDGRVHTQPLAGTRALTADDAERDERLRAELLDDPKEVFEHAMAVRNSYRDMRAVCTPESVAITDFMEIQRRGGVQHIGSRVTGRLAPRLSPWDAFSTLMPTLIGSPRPAAYELIRRYEKSPRGLYGGAVLTADSSGALDAALAIRTVFQQHGRSWLRAGVGVVPQSTPERECEETCEKLRSVASYLVERTA